MKNKDCDADTCLAPECSPDIHPEGCAEHSDFDDTQIQINSNKYMTKSVMTAIEYLSEVVHKDCGTKNGKTALYWHIVAVISQHAGQK